MLDLTLNLIKFVDVHLGIKLIEFVEEKKLYNANDLLNAKLTLLKKTKLLEKRNDVYQKLHAKPDPEFEKSKKVLGSAVAELKASTDVFEEIFQDEQAMADLKNEKVSAVQFLMKDFDLKSENISNLYKYAALLYQSGDYVAAAQFFDYFRQLSTDFELCSSALWGKLNSEILAGNNEKAFSDFLLLKESIEQTSSLQYSHLQQLENRTWLLHAALFVLLSHPKNGKDTLIDLFFQPQYINTIQTSCPWILRYLTLTVVTNKKRKNMLKDLVKILKQEHHVFSDPITDVLECIFLDYNFEKAQVKLLEGEKVLESDYFLHPFLNEFLNQAKILIFETYCRIYQNIGIKSLSEKLNFDEIEGEKWIVNVIRDARMDAKIDAKTKTVIMGTQSQTIYQQVIEKTKSLSFKSSMLAANIEKKEQEIACRNQEINA
ncbi:Eukaryotic translation initiation factor 3 subunit E [Clydaea vesicula]|uniref:Eukaryotic translation initiation factor 3 subunit E n=1 Tax=Clydaea vesicula TaxID=447962 RepID=A0AAD5XUG9_9FUNG|nr:Eukaryotic translation initiation factor 3 subunit E [Clydaea vesicula]KAJ3397813.1 Eukaryotic translation initiation factor 3 subunit E [Lobulomyces angularis]